MRHKRDHKKLSRNSSHRKAMLRNMTTSFIEHGRIITTLAKAKEMRRIAEKMVTMARVDNVDTRRRAASFLKKTDGKNIAITKLFKELAPKYKERNGGYTRIYKIGPRKGDGAFEAIVEFV